MNLISQRWIVYQHSNTKDIIPKQGEMLVIKDTPYFGNLAVYILGDGVQTIDILCRKILNLPILTADYDNYVPRAGEMLGAFREFNGAQIVWQYIGDGTHTFGWLKAQTPPTLNALLAMITSEQTARQEADTALEAKIADVKNIAEASSVVLSFQNPAQLAEWMSGAYQRADGKLPSDLRTGWKAVFVEEVHFDKWWDGDSVPPQWRDIEAQTDLSGYRTAEAQDIIDDTKAPLASPQLTGIPTTPEPDFTIRDQIATAGLVMDLFNLMISVLPNIRIIKTADGLDIDFRATIDENIRQTE